MCKGNTHLGFSLKRKKTQDCYLICEVNLIKKKKKIYYTFFTFYMVSINLCWWLEHCTSVRSLHMFLRLLQCLCGLSFTVLKFTFAFVFLIVSLVRGDLILIVMRKSWRKHWRSQTSIMTPSLKREFNNLRKFLCYTCTKIFLRLFLLIKFF